jgi:hypothetical protein
MNDDTYDNHTCHDNCPRIACVLRRELTAMTQQRDEWKAKYTQQNKDLGCEMMDPNGTIWDHAKKVQLELIAMTEQRDRLAEALEQIANTNLDKCDDECAKFMFIALIHNAKQACQSLTTTQTEPK